MPEDQKPFYVLYADETAGNWRIQAVSLTPHSFENRKSLPEPSVQDVMVRIVSSADFPEGGEVYATRNFRKSVGSRVVFLSTLQDSLEVGHSSSQPGHARADSQPQAIKRKKASWSLHAKHWLPNLRSLISSIS